MASSARLGLFLCLVLLTLCSASPQAIRASIDLENHFLNSAFVGPLRASNAVPEWIIDKLLSLGQLRLQEMNQGGVSLQVVSHNPAVGTLTTCQQANDELHAAIQQHPDRFAGFAMLPMSDPTAAADELERCIKDLGFVGALINNHDNGRFYDNETYWVVFERALQLGVPVYLHPVSPTEQMLEIDYEGNYPQATANLLGVQAWGWHEEVGLHILRLFVSGFFDTFPNIQIVIGHMGEMLPFQLDRVINIAEPYWLPRQRNLRTVWNENIWVTTSGMFTLPPFTCLLSMKSIDKIMYSVDWPYSNNTDGEAFLREIRRSGLLTEEEFEKFAYKNVQTLLKLSLPGRK